MAEYDFFNILHSQLASTLDTPLLECSRAQAYKQNLIMLYERTLHYVPLSYTYVNQTHLSVYNVVTPLYEVFHVCAKDDYFPPLLPHIRWGNDSVKSLYISIVKELAMQYFGKYGTVSSFKPLSKCGDRWLNARAFQLGFKTNNFPNACLLALFDLEIEGLNMEHKGDLIECVIGHSPILQDLFCEFAKGKPPWLFLPFDKMGFENGPPLRCGHLSCVPTR